MEPWQEWLILAVMATLSAFVGSVAGSGGSTILLPILVLFYGIRDAIPIITIANLSANISRAVLNRGEIVLPVAGWFTLGAVPLVVLGAWLFTLADPGPLTRALGALLLGLLCWRRLRPRPPRPGGVRWFAPLGALFGFLEGVLGHVGPLMAPFFLAQGLLKGAYIGTDALATVAMQGTKLAVFGAAELLDGWRITAGLLLVPFMVLGTILGKVLTDRLPAHVFVWLIEGVILLAGLNFLLRG